MFFSKGNFLVNHAMQNMPSVAITIPICSLEYKNSLAKKQYDLEYNLDYSLEYG